MGNSAPSFLKTFDSKYQFLNSGTHPRFKHIKIFYNKENRHDLIAEKKYGDEYGEHLNYFIEYNKNTLEPSF